MKEEIKKKWVKALKSGKFTQTDNKLKRLNTIGNPASHCCLGVLCELFIEDTGNGAWDTEGWMGQAFVVDGIRDACEPPKPVLEWAGLTDEADISMLVAHNDPIHPIDGGQLDPHSFKEIATLIDTYL